MSSIINNQDIKSLINLISSEIENSKNNLNIAFNTQKTISYWNIGKHIDNHLLSHSETTDYGQYLFAKLAESLYIGKRSLYLSVQFYKTYNNIDSICNKITWNHFKILLTIRSEERRTYYEQILFNNNLTYRDFFNLVKKDKDNLITYKGDRLTFNKGTPYLYSLKIKNNKPLLDLGFHTYSDFYSDKFISFNADSIIQTSKTTKGYSFNKADFDHSSLYTYKAFITNVIDGDTIKDDIDIGFNTIVNKTLRLRGINAFEIPTPEGKKAKNFVTAKLSKLDFIVIKTYQPDKYSRYLADVFYSKKHTDLISIINKGSFLNQELLDNNLAVKYYIY